MSKPPLRRIQGASKRSFTLIELSAVVLIITILLVSVIPKLDNMAPSSRLSAGARYVAGTIETAQSEAISQRQEFVVAYDLDRNTYWIILPEGHERGPDDTGDTQSPGDPALDAMGEGGSKAAGDRPEDDLEHGMAPPEEGGENSEEDKDEATEASFADREAFEPNELPMSVEFKSVSIGDDTRTSGRVYVSFDHRGTTGAHLVALQLEDVPGGGGPQGEMWLRFDPLTRTLTYSEEQPQVPTLEGD
jgi:type II secretory pathway pseudopilin PulG